MNTTPNATPAPIIHEDRLMYVDDSEMILTNQRGDRFNLSTGEVAVARIINGTRYDTAHATLVVGCGLIHGYGCYTLHRLYRIDQGKYFLLHMQWATDLGFVGAQEISLVEDDNVLATAKNLMRNVDVPRFLRNWYCSGLLPHDDAFAQEWAESVLSADECEAVLAGFGGRYAAQSGHVSDA